MVSFYDRSHTRMRKKSSIWISGLAKLGPEPLGLSVQELRDLREQNHVFSQIAEYHSMTFTLIGVERS